MPQLTPLLFALALSAGARTARADRFDDAERAAERFLAHAQDLRRLDVEQVRSLVQAICDADEDERRSVARDASSRAKDKVGSEHEKLDREKNDAIASLEAVRNDAAFKDKHGRASDLKRRVEDAWRSVELMTRAIRGANHPVVKECKTFEHRVDCYRLCPDIDENGDFRTISADWSTGC